MAVDAGATREELSAITSKLDNYLDAGLARAVNRNLTFVETLFIISHTHKTPPRICTKASIKMTPVANGFVEDPDGTEFVCDLFRHKAGYRKRPFPIMQNSGLPTLRETARTTSTTIFQMTPST